MVWKIAPSAWSAEFDSWVRNDLTSFTTNDREAGIICRHKQCTGVADEVKFHKGKLDNALFVGIELVLIASEPHCKVLLPANSGRHHGHDPCNDVGFPPLKGDVPDIEPVWLVVFLNI